MALKQLSEGADSKVPESSVFTDEPAVNEVQKVSSSYEAASSCVESGVKETSRTATDKLKDEVEEVLEGDHGQLSESSVSKNESAEEKVREVDFNNEALSSDTEVPYQETSPNAREERNDEIQEKENARRLSSSSSSSSSSSDSD